MSDTAGGWLVLLGGGEFSFGETEDAAYIVGQTLVVDGGLSATVAFSR